MADADPTNNPNSEPGKDAFADILAANEQYAAGFTDPGLTGRAGRGLGVLTCIDSRIDPLAVLGLRPGDAKIVRNAGARVTEDALRSLVLATNLLNVQRICVIQHTSCAMAGTNDEAMHTRIHDATGLDASAWYLGAMPDQLTALAADLEKLRACALLAPGVVVEGFVLDVHTGRLQPVS